MEPISAAELLNRLNHSENLNLLDVREVIEYHTYHIGGKNIPLSVFSEKIELLEYNKSDEVIVICKAGIRSETACTILKQNGFEKARNLTGGLLAIQRLKQLNAI